MRRARLVFVTLVGACLLLAVVLAVWHNVGYWFYYPYDDRPFDRSVWLRNAGVSGENPRGRMAEDVRHRVIRPGMPRREIHALLGGPSRPRPGQPGEPTASADWYFLGNVAWFHDYGYLVVSYGNDGKVVSTSIRELD